MLIILVLSLNYGINGYHFFRYKSCFMLILLLALKVTFREKTNVYQIQLFVEMSAYPKTAL